MRYLSIDQSLSSCGCVVFEDDKPIYKKLIKTGSTSAKGKQKKDVTYFDKEVQQMAHICIEVSTLVQQFDVEHVILESLSFGSIGTATRSLAGLFYCINYTLLLDGFPVKNIHTIAPTQVKSYARQFLPEEDQTEENSKGKVIKAKMSKKQMFKAVESLDKDFLKGYSVSSGGGDLADSFWIGKRWYEELIKNDYENH